MRTDEIREKYLSFFESKGHTRRPSDVLVPTWDPSVLFTPAGMNQFKPHFLGKVKLEFTRATTCQKCLRTGDIDNVGRTAYHHTFFEMLGNFSFGDYFKRDAITWAWEFLTQPAWLGLDADRLTVTVYHDDDEAAGIWANDIGLSNDRIERMGEADNFWPASAPSEGPDGVCGPCSEIFYHGADGKPVEIWNLVFTQFNRVGDPPGNLRPLPSKNIDTGMGLERTAAVLQGVETNYHIDILRPIVEATAAVCNVSYVPDSDEGRRLRRITDHVRACTFAIHENVYPGPHKEKYVIRRLLRRAVLDGRQIGRREPFLHELVPAVIANMKSAYPELTETSDRVAGVIEQEEKAFFATIDDGLQRIERIFDDLAKRDRTIVEGAEAADLYQTYGVPAELFESLASDRGYAFDWNGYREAMEQHGEASGKLAHSVMTSSGPIDAIKKSVKESKFLGYESTHSSAEVKGLVLNQQLHDEVSSLDDDDTLIVVLDQTPYYGESGGQVGDVGTIRADGVTLEVVDTQKDGDLVLHYCRKLSGRIAVGMTVKCDVDDQRRSAVRRAHSATHILHFALQKHLGSHAQQQGSKVTDDWLRFDFSNLAPVSVTQLDHIESDVRDLIAAGKSVEWKTVPLDEARAAGAMMLFGEKYPDPVRMVSMGEFSRELCGGTHVSNTGDIQHFELIGEEGVAAGTRRITALTGTKAAEYTTECQNALQKAAEILSVKEQNVGPATRLLLGQVRDLKKALSGGKKSTSEASSDPQDTSAPPNQTVARQQLAETARILNVPLFDVPNRLQGLIKELATVKTQLEQREQQGAISVEDLMADAENVAGVNVVVAEVPLANGNLLRQLIDQIRQDSAPCAVLLATVEGEQKITLVAGVSRDIQKRIHAGNWVKDVAPQIGGGGGGRPDMAQAGGKVPAKLPAALDHARQYAAEQLASE